MRDLVVDGIDMCNDMMKCYSEEDIEGMRNTSNCMQILFDKILHFDGKKLFTGSNGFPTEDSWAYACGRILRYLRDIRIYCFSPIVERGEADDDMRLIFKEAVYSLGWETECILKVIDGEKVY